MLRKLLLFLALAGSAFAQGITTSTARRVVTGSSLPATCAVGDIFFKTTATIGTYQCTSTNTWVAMGGGGGSVAWGGITGILPDQTDLAAALAAKLPLAGGTMTGSLLFTDASFDIGASGATRPRDIFTSRDVTVGRNLAVGTSLSVDGSTGIATTSKIGNAALSLLTGAGKWSSGVPVGQAACADLSNGGTGCSATIANYATLASPTFTGTVTLPATGTVGGTFASLNLTNATALPLTTGVTGILPGANGGTANGFFAVSGPASTLKTWTIPNSSIDWTALTGPAYLTAGVPRIATGTCNSSTFVAGDGSCSAISSAFSILTSATNSQAAMVVGTGASLDVSGSGTINATSLGGTAAASYATLAGSQALTNKTYNGNTFTAGTGILTIAAAKTLTASNTLTFTGTDSSSVAFGAGGTVLYNTSPIGFILGNVATGVVALSSTSYFGPMTTTANTQVNLRQSMMGSAAHITNFYLHTTSTQNAGGSMVCSLYVNGTVASALTFTIAAGAASAVFSDSHSVAVAQGDLIAFGCLNNWSGGNSAGIDYWGASILP